MILSKVFLRNIPLLKDLKNLLYEQGAVYAAMSGSGSSVFGLFESRPKLNCVDSSIFLV